MDDTNREDRIRDRAYQLWEGDGRPDGRHEQHWHQAAGEIDGDSSSLATDEGAASGGMSPDGGPAPGADSMAARGKGGKALSGANQES